MGLPANKLPLDDFIAWENAQTERHEFVRGEVFAMVGARRTFGVIVGNLMREFGVVLKGSPCRPFSAGMKLQIGGDTTLCPDVFVTCDRADLRTEMIFTSPLLVNEVLSPTTQTYDRSRKSAFYRRLTALRKYVLIDPDSRDVQTFRRNAAGERVLHDMTEAPSLLLPCINAGDPMIDFFEGVEPLA